MSDLRFYLSLFRRRLPWFLVLATIVSAAAVIVAYTLPPAYESRMVLLVEPPQIPEDLAASTVQTPAFQQLQVMEQRLLARSNMLDIARRLDVLRDQDKMNPDQIVDAMRARTRIRTTSGREAPLMTISFEAPNARTAAAVLGEYLTLIQRQDSELRRAQSSETLVFFQQEVERLAEELSTKSDEILTYKQEHSDALPEGLEFRINQRSELQDRLTAIDLQMSDLKNRTDRLMQLYELTGGAGGPGPLSPEQQQLQDLRAQLDAALMTYSPTNPRVKQLEARIAQVEASIGTSAPAEDDSEGEKPLPPMMVVQLSEIESQIQGLQDRKAAVQKQLDKVNDALERSPEVSIGLDQMTRTYASLEQQYAMAEDRLSKARTGDLIETRSRGQRLVVIEQPAVPSQPTKPNRMMIAGGGIFMGIAAGLGLVLLIEMLNGSARRPEDIVKRLGVTPITTIPYTRTRSQKVIQRSAKLLLILAILVVIPAGVWAVHTYYLPLDLIADRIMDKMGVRW